MPLLTKTSENFPNLDKKEQIMGGVRKIQKFSKLNTTEIYQY